MDTNGKTHRRLVVVGHVDHGKSTLIGRILLATNRVSTEKINSVKKLCQKKGMNFEPAFLLDGLEEEREQGITIDTARVNIEYAGKHFCIIDAPGHAEFLRNMTTGASNAELGILVFDCQPGARAQALQHIKTLSMIGVREVICLVNKMDTLAYNKTGFESASDWISSHFASENMNCLEIIPISAYEGENIFEPSNKMPWYKGQALMSVLCSLEVDRVSDPALSAPFRMLLQDVYKFGQERLYAGRVMSGQVKVGAELCFSPSGKRATIKEIKQYPDLSLPSASCGDSIALTLSEDLFLERGELVSFPYEAPEIETEISARLLWLGKDDYDPNADYTIKIGTAESSCALTVLNENGQAEDKSLRNGEFTESILTFEKPLAFDRCGNMSKFVICSRWETVAAGTMAKQSLASRVQARGAAYQETGFIERKEFEARQGHRAAVIWLTGLSGAGKSTLAKRVQRQLFFHGRQVQVLDGDNLRQGLCSDLAFSPADRSENVRRIAHAAKLFLDTGNIVIVACISPYKRDREQAKQIIGADSFLEVFVYCPLEVCRERDPKGLYRSGKSGGLPGLTGVDAPYQTPDSPSLVIDTSRSNPDMASEAVLELISQTTAFEVNHGNTQKNNCKNTELENRWHLAHLNDCLDPLR